MGQEEVVTYQQLLDMVCQVSGRWPMAAGALRLSHSSLWRRRVRGNTSHAKAAAATRWPHCNRCWLMMQWHVYAVRIGKQGSSVALRCGCGRYWRALASAQLRGLHAWCLCRLARARSLLQAASYLRSVGVKKGDDVTIYMPMVPQLPAVMVSWAEGAGRSHRVQQHRPLSMSVCQCLAAGVQKASMRCTRTASTGGMETLYEVMLV